MERDDRFNVQACWSSCVQRNRTAPPFQITYQVDDNGEVKGSLLALGVPCGIGSIICHYTEQCLLHNTVASENNMIDIQSSTAAANRK